MPQHRIHFDIHLKTKLKYNAFSAGKYAIFWLLVCLCRFRPPFVSKLNRHTTRLYSHILCSVGQSLSSSSVSVCLCLCVSVCVHLCLFMEFCMRLRTNATHPRDQMKELFHSTPFVLQHFRSIQPNGSKINSMWCLRVYVCV